MPEGRSVSELEQDYVDVMKRVRELPKEERRRLEAYRDFIQQRNHLLARWPGQLLPLAHAEPEASRVLAAARLYFNDGPDRPWLRLLNPPPPRAWQRTLEVGCQVRAVACLAIGGVAHVLCGCEDGLLRLYNLATAELVRKYVGHTDAVWAVAVTADGLAVSGSRDQTVRVWELGRGQCVAVFPWDYPVTAVAVTPQPPHVVGVGDSQGNVLFFRIENLDRV